MRVAITHTRYTHKGGVERYIYDLVRRLLDAGHEVHYFCHFWDEHIDHRVKLHKIPNPWKQIRFMKVWSYDRWVTKRVRREKFDVVHGFSKSSRQDIYTDGSGCLLDYQSYSIDRAGGGKLKRSMRRKSLHQKQILSIEQRRFTRGNFSRVVTMSDLAADQIRTRYELDTSEVVTIYNGIDTERFKPENRERYREEYLERLVVPPNSFVALCVGNDYTRKGIPALIETARIVKERGGLPDGRALRIAVVGKERHGREKKLVEECKQKGVWDTVKFYGIQNLVEQWHAMADLFVLPTLFDAFGNVVLEALATGVPALVSSKAGAAEVLTEGTDGWTLSDPEDAGAIADRLLELAGDEAKRRKMSAAARECAERYSWDRHFERILGLYEEVAQAKKVAVSQ